MCWGCFCISMKGRVHVLSSTPCPLLRSVTLISQTADQSELNWVREVPLYGQRIYMKRGCLSRLCVCVWLYRGCMTLHDFYGLWSDLEYHFDWKTEDDTHKHTAGSRLCGMCINKQGVGSHSTKTNPNCQTAQLLTMSLCCCLHAHFSQLSSDTPRPSQALKTHSTPSSPLPLQCFI